MMKGEEYKQTLGILIWGKHVRIPTTDRSWLEVRILHIPQGSCTLLLENSMTEFPKVNKTISGIWKIILMFNLCDFIMLL